VGFRQNEYDVSSLDVALDQPMIETACDALRWIASQSVPAEGGLAWLRPNWPDRRAADDLYEGTAGVLVGLAEARLTGITEFDDVAYAATARLKWLTGRVVGGGGGGEVGGGGGEGE
jgi:hypothetical protein